MKIESRRSREIESKVLSVGLDIAKEAHWVATRCHGFADGRALRIAVNDVGFERLIGYLESEKERTGATAVIVGLESTGHYGVTVSEYLRSHGYEVRYVNPFHTSRMKEIIDNSPEKSDPKDAAVIAELVHQGKYLSQVANTGVFAELREASRLRRSLTVELGRRENRIHRTLDMVFPELLAILPPMGSSTTFGLLRKALTPADFQALGVMKLTRLLKKVSRGQLGRELAEAILATASRSVGASLAIGMHRLSLSQELASWEHASRQRLVVEERQKALLKEVPYAENLASISGIGPTTVATVLGETGDLRAYTSAKAVLKVAGINLYRSSSGKKLGPTRISKRGRSRLRHGLFLATLSMVSREGATMYAYFQRLVRENGMLKMKAMVAAMRKLVGILFALVRDGAMFDPKRVSVDLEKVA